MVTLDLPFSAGEPASLDRPPLQRDRIASVDLLRGLVMLLMVLDHARYYFSASRVSPEDMDATTLPLFLTRWVTHLCAPVFFLFTGLSIYLSRERRAGGASVRTLTALRGLWLILLELTIVGFAWSFTPGHSVAGVIWSLGWAMLFVAAISALPVGVVAAIGIAMMVGHDLFDAVSPEPRCPPSRVPWEISSCPRMRAGPTLSSACST